MNRSAIVLAGGFSSRFGQDKGLLQLVNKPLIRHVLDAIKGVVDEQVVVASSKSQAESYAEAVGSSVRVLVDTYGTRSPLLGALTGFEKVHGRYSLLLPCDTPLVSRDVISLLFELCINRNAVIPRWPNGYIEPLQAVYRTKPASKAARDAISKGQLNMRSMVDRLNRVRYVSTLVLRQSDPKLRTFFNINTPSDLKKAKLIFNESTS